MFSVMESLKSKGIFHSSKKTLTSVYLPSLLTKHLKKKKLGGGIVFHGLCMGHAWGTEGAAWATFSEISCACALICKCR